jgi:hypothetical protein
MKDDQDLKSRLPYPYNHDLSGILRRLDRRTPFSRHRLANDPVTAAYIAAGMRLIQRHLGPDPQRVRNDPDDVNSLDRPLWGFLSQRAVAAEVANNPEPFPRSGSTSTLRCSWHSHSDYIADLLSFGLWHMHRSAYSEPRIAADTEHLVEGAGFVETVHRLSRHVLDNFSGPTFRLSLVAAAAADGDEVIRDVLSEGHRGAIEPWRQVFAETLRSRGLRLRPGIDLEQFSGMMEALSMGYSLRRLSDPVAFGVSSEQDTSRLGTAVLALLVGCLESVDAEQQGTSVEVAVRDLVGDRTTSDTTHSNSE